MNNDRIGPGGSEDSRHYMRCPDCGCLFDMRDLMAVLEHQHRAAVVPEIRYTNAAAVTMPFRFPRHRPDSN